MKNTAFRSMGTNVEIMISEPNDQTESDINQTLWLAQEKMMSLEFLLSRFRNDSDVSRMNSSAGQWVEVSADTVQVLLLAKEAFMRTRGFFNPFMGQVLENLGYNVTFESIGRKTGFTLSVGNPFVAPVHVPLDIDERAFRARIEPGYKIDLGGIAKGWIVEQTAEVLVNHGISNFICNAGGDLICKGFNEGAPWVIGITNPFDSQKNIVNLDVQNMCVATSGTYRRKWSFGNREMHHILDPFLGHPVETDIASCSVIHQSLTEAEILAKVGLILGSVQGIPWLEKQSTNGWVVVTNTGEVKYSCNL